MKPLYAKLTRSLKPFFCLLAVILLLGACSGGGYSSSQPWGMTGNQGIVTADPHSQPDIAWQTYHQRKNLSDENAALAQHPATAPVAARQQSVKVGILLPLSGRHAELGQSMLKAAQMALFDVGSATYELMPIDTRSTAAGADAAARNAVAAKTDLVLGPIFSEDVRAVKPLLASANIPMIAFTTDWTLAGNGTYIMGFLPFAQVARVTQYVEDQAVKNGTAPARFAAFGPRTEYCDVVFSTLQRTGARIVRTSRFEAGETNLSPLVEAFANDTRILDIEGNTTAVRFDALMLPLGGEGLRTIASLFDQHGINNKNVRLIGTGLWDDDSLTRNPTLFGGLFAAPDPALRRDFEKRYRDNYGSTAPRLTTLAYDATALSAVLSRTASGGDVYSRQRLTNPRGFAGIDGLFRFRSDGLSERGLAVLEIQSGMARVVDAAPTAFASGS